MRQDHVAGDKTFVDYSGTRPRIFDPAEECRFVDGSRRDREPRGGGFANLGTTAQQSSGGSASLHASCPRLAGGLRRPPDVAMPRC
jgi:hypothetical protein